MIESLKARGDKLADDATMLLYLFLCYTTCKDEQFSAYIKSIKDDWEFKDTPESKDLIPHRLMHKAETYFKTSVTCNQ